MKRNNLASPLALLIASTLLLSSLGGCAPIPENSTSQTDTPAEQAPKPIVAEDLEYYLVTECKQYISGALTETITYRYDRYGNPLEAYWDNKQTGEQKVIFTGEVEYDESERPVKATTSFYSYHFAYDEHTQLASVTVKAPDGTVHSEYVRNETGEFPYTVTEYTDSEKQIKQFNADGKMVQIAHYSVDGTELYSDSYTYSEKGNLIRETRVSAGGIEDHEYTYTDEDYDQFGIAMVKQGNDLSVNDPADTKQDISEYFGYFPADQTTEVRKYTDTNNTAVYDAWVYDTNGNLLEESVYTGWGHDNYCYTAQTIWGDGLLAVFLANRPTCLMQLGAQY